MSVLRAVAINSLLSLALFIVLCTLCGIRSEPLRFATTTTTTARPYRGPGLSLPMRNTHPPKCMREVPAVFFQYEKNIKIVGNSTNSPYYNQIEVCCQGYKRYEYDWNKCVPDCGQKCLSNGFCMEGGVCQCFSDFVLNHRNDCVPICPLGCPNGQCYLNGTCVCNRNYELDPTRKYCMPKCDPACGYNELCIEPQRCECAEGYARSLHSGCQPMCIPHCGHGHCVGPNQCECFLGYVKRENRTICEHNCYMRCENGFCVNRTTCICHNGYRYDLDTNSCLPECGQDCENGVCIAPGNCRCFNGYRRNATKCEAICERGCGFYGKCIAPNVCGCSLTPEQYKFYQPCEHGFCNAEGRCRCQEGHMRFVDKCLPPDQITTYASISQYKLNEALFNEFQLLIGKHFEFPFLKRFDLFGNDMLLYTLM